MKKESVDKKLLEINFNQLSSQNVELLVIRIMESEQIKKIGKIVYMKLFDDFGYIKNPIYVSYIEIDGNHYDCKKIFWRFYYIID